MEIIEKNSIIQNRDILISELSEAMEKNEENEENKEEKEL